MLRFGFSLLFSTYLVPYAHTLRCQLKTRRRACASSALPVLGYRTTSIIYRLQKEKALFGKTFRSPVQKFKLKYEDITKKVQAYFKHLCALIKIWSKMIWVCITKICLILFSYDEKKTPTTVAYYLLVYIVLHPDTGKFNRFFIKIINLSSPICNT